MFRLIFWIEPEARQGTWSVTAGDGAFFVGGAYPGGDPPRGRRGRKKAVGDQ